MTRWRAVLMVGVVCGALAACSDDGDDSATATTPAAGSTATEAPPSNEAVTTAAVTTETSDETTADATADTTVETTADAIAPAAAWETIVAPPDCMCGDGSELSFFVRKADPAKVMLFFEGGGACFSAETCDPAGGTYKGDVGNGPGDEGIFDFSNPENPLADYSVVFVPYCTGDVHIGNNTNDYGNGVVVEHKGFVNGTAALNTLAEMFPEATELVVAGESAGSVPSPLYAGLAADLLPNASITVLADGSGAYPDVPGINGVIGAVWGTMNAVPDWPVNADVTTETWSFPGLFVKAGTHAPDITFARHDYAFDQTQVFFAGLAGIPADDLVSLIDQNEAQVEAGGVPLYSFITQGDSHTVLGKPAFYTESVDGVSLLDWVTALVVGEPVDDVHCTVCTVGG